MAGTSVSTPTGEPAQQAPGAVSGIVVDSSGAAVAGAHLTLTHDDATPARETLSDANGEFVFADVPPGAFQVVIAAAGLASQTYTGTKIADQASTVPTITLAVASESTQVQVSVSRVELAEDEIKIQEKQRVLGVFPNFYVSYDPDAVPLSSKQKFELAWRTTIDPVTFVLTGATAGVQQWQNNFSGYGQGAQGYAKRYGAIYADTVTGTFLGGAVFPSLFKQDPRYFYKGTGTVRSRFLYAIANAVICKGDNRKWQPAYSSILGDLASGGISNAYYPSSDRGAALVFENTLIGIGTTAAANVLQEFLIRKLTPGQSNNNTSLQP
ncbi:MAG: carboxypeptidase-like regulatory domain-containing protein [Candidatus Acidiferrales bacterium]